MGFRMGFRVLLGYEFGICKTQDVEFLRALG